MKQKKKVAFLLVGVVLIVMVTAICVLLFSKDEKVIGLKKSFISSIQRQDEVQNQDTTPQTDQTENEDGITTDTSKWDLNKVDRVKVRYKPEVSNESSQEGLEEMQADEASPEEGEVTEEPEYVYVPVPKGYKVSQAKGENAVKTGLVIYESDEDITDSNVDTARKEKNQWVWVPVNEPTRLYDVTSGKMKAKLYSFNETGRTNYSNSNYEPGILTSYDNERYFARYDLQGMTREIFLKELQEQFEATIKSIEKYGGFYIGRYETGDLSKSKPVVKAMNTDIGSQTWYAMYRKTRHMCKNTDIQSSMIWGCLWDETLQWIVESGGKGAKDMKDSTSWGNYKDATFQYKSSSSASSESTKNLGSSTRIPTGSTDYTKANNIYDLAGNVYDWTLEGYGSYGRRHRGGIYNYYGSSYPASYRNDYYPYYSSTYYGCRAYFYIK